MPKIFPRCARDMPKICQRYAQDMPKLWPPVRRSWQNVFLTKRLCQSAWKKCRTNRSWQNVFLTKRLSWSWQNVFLTKRLRRSWQNVFLTKRLLTFKHAFKIGEGLFREIPLHCFKSKSNLSHDWLHIVLDIIYSTIQLKKHFLLSKLRHSFVLLVKLNFKY